jgi:hypothetical protein
MEEARTLEELLALLRAGPATSLTMDVVRQARSVLLDLERHVGSRIVEEAMASRRIGSHDEHMTLAYGRAVSQLIDEWEVCLTNGANADIPGVVRSLASLLERWLESRW